MQPVFDMLMKYARDLQRISNVGNIKLVRVGNRAQISAPGSVIQCNYLLPWIKSRIKYGVISDKHRIHYINIINDLYSNYSEDDTHLYFEVIKGVVKVYRLSPDFTSKVLLHEINLVPYSGWLWSKLLTI